MTCKGAEVTFLQSFADTWSSSLWPPPVMPVEGDRITTQLTVSVGPYLLNWWEYSSPICPYPPTYLASSESVEFSLSLSNPEVYKLWKCHKCSDFDQCCNPVDIIFAVLWFPKFSLILQWKDLLSSSLLHCFLFCVTNRGERLQKYHIEEQNSKRYSGFFVIAVVLICIGYHYCPL